MRWPEGYGVAESVVSASDCDELVARLAGVGRSRAGARHLLALVRDVADALRPLAGGGVPFRATLFDKSADANWLVAWHQDTALPLRERVDAPGWGPWSTKLGVLYAHAPAEALERVIALRLHLDDSTRANGPLRVIPGSHRLGVLSDDEVARIAETSAAADCLVSRGGVVAMRPLLIHSSPRLDTPMPRRVLHIEYAESLAILPGIELALC